MVNERYERERQMEKPKQRKEQEVSQLRIRSMSCAHAMFVYIEGIVLVKIIGEAAKYDKIDEWGVL